MSDLQFNTGENEFGAPPQAPQGTDMASRLVQWGLVSDRQQATYALIGIGVLALVVAFFLIRSSGGDLPPPPPTGV